MNDKTVESYEWVLQTLITNTKAVSLMIITDNDLAVNAAIASILSDTNHIYCIYHIGQNLIKNLKGKLGEHNLLTKFSDASSYLNCALFGEKERQNGIIKNSVNSSTTLINLVKYIDEQIDRASTFVKYKNWIHSITEIAQAIWYTSRLINFQDLGFNSIEQANLIEQSDLNEEFNLTEESDINRILDNFVEDIVDAPATLVKELISTTEVELIHEVWK
ncbi:24603_t:CDS:2, partial [Gigaspora margarita]